MLVLIRALTFLEVVALVPVAVLCFEVLSAITRRETRMPIYPLQRGSVSALIPAHNYALVLKGTFRH